MVLEIENLLLPDDNDILLTDVTETLFHSIEMDLGIKNGTRTTQHPEYPIVGMITGSYYRMWIPLIVRKRDVSVHAIFLYDTGSPFTHLSKEIMELLGYTHHTPDMTLVNIHGVNINVYLSKNHFQNINLLGQDFMTLCQLEVSTSYKELTFQFNK